MALPQTGSIVARWSADDLSLSNNDPVTSWTSGVGSIVAAQATGSKQPLYITNVYGSKPAVRFDGVNDLLTIATPGALATAINSQTFSVMIVFREIATTSSTYGTLFSYTYTTPASGTAYYIADDGRLHRYPMGGGGFTTPFTATDTFASFGVTSGDAGVINNAGTERAFVNGTCTHSILALSGGGTTAAYAIGCDAGENFPVNADIFDIIVWDVELTPPEVLQFHDWACTKYSQTTPWNSLTKFVVFDGDSITAGTGASNVAGSYPYKAAQSLGLSYGQWTNTGIGYLTAANMNTKFSTDVEPYETLTGKTLHVAAFEWYNQRAAAPTPANSSLTYLSTVRASGAKVCFGTSTDSSIAAETDRDDYNDYFDANHTSATMDAYVPIHDNIYIGLEGATTTYASYFDDGIHLSDTGYTTLASLFVTGLNAIPAGGSVMPIIANHNIRRRA